MKKSIASIFLTIFIAAASACSAQPQQIVQTTAETTDSSVSSEETTVAVTGSEAMATESETAAIVSEITSGTTSAAEAETTTAEQTEITTTEETTAATTTEKTTTAAAITTTVTTTAAETTTAKKTSEKTKKTSAETTSPEITTEETKMTEPEQTEPKVIALTFDDGPNTTTTNEVLDVLEKYGIKASFFLIGNNIDSESAKSVKRAYDMGCEIGNHSKTHSYMDKMSIDEIVAEIEETNEKIVDITGEEPKFFRPPYISVNKDMIENIDMPFIAGYGANDWIDKYTAEHRAKLVIRQARDGGIILLHDAKGNSQTVQALDIIIPELQSQGYEFVTISEVFARKGITPEAHNGKIYSYAEQVGEYS